MASQPRSGSACQFGSARQSARQSIWQSGWARAVALTAASACCAQAALADEVQEQLHRMDQRIEQLEQQLEATHDELAAANARAVSQQEMIERAGLDERERSLSGLARWLQQTQFDGWVASSYWYNTNQPDPSGNGNRGNLALGPEADGLAYPFHRDHNSFQLDQLWFKMKKDATPESRGGYGVDLVFGATADALRPDIGNSGDLSSVYQAYAQYLAPIGPGVLFNVGRMRSTIGAEEVETVYTFNISQGLVNTLLEPNNFMGITAQSWIGPVAVLFGVSNDTTLNLNSDGNAGKAMHWSLAMDATQKLAVEINGMWGDSAVLPARGPLPPGATPNPANDKLGIVNLVLRWDPSDLLATWLSFDYAWTRGQEALVMGSLVPVPGHPRVFGVALASRYAIAEQTGFAFRGEVIYGRDNFLDPTLLTERSDHTLWSLTGTFDHTFAENFVVRVEGRYDAGEQEGGDSIFFRDRSFGDFRHDQFVAGVQAYYRF
jgi:hypothetical protein